MASAASFGRRWMDGSIWKVHLALIATQVGAAGYYVLTKASLTDGVDKIVFAVYRNVLGFLMVAFFGYFLEKGERKRMDGSLLALLLLAGATGIYGNQILFMTGLALTSTAYAAAVQIANPMFIFLIAILFRVESVRWRMRDGQAKIVGVIFTLSGAMFMTFYQGPIILGSEAPKLVDASTDKLAIHTTQTIAAILNKYGITPWQFGSACLVANTLCMGIYVNLQAPILARYPAPLSETAFAMLFGVLLLGVTGYVTVETSAWTVTSAVGIASIVYAGAVASCLNFALNTWCFQKSGPFLVGAYIPLQPVVSAIFGLIFLGDVVYLGSVLGAMLVTVGLFFITWGKVQSKRELSLCSDVKQPLLDGKT